jgi:hypothetical protein
MNQDSQSQFLEVASRILQGLVASPKNKKTPPYALADEAIYLASILIKKVELKFEIECKPSFTEEDKPDLRSISQKIPYTVRGDTP